MHPTPLVRLRLFVPTILTALAACHGDPAVDDTDVQSDTDGPRYATEFTVVTVDGAASAPTQLAVQACAGLSNRALGGSIYVSRGADDEAWLDTLDLTASRTIDAAAFLAECGAAFPTCVRYDYAAQQRLLPAVLSAAAANGAVPLDVGMDVPCGEVVFDATTELRDATPHDATKLVADRWLDRTTGLAMLNPGYDQSGANNPDPAIVRDMAPALVDLVFTRRLFVTFLVNGCVVGDPERDLMQSIVDRGAWSNPIEVYGYNNSWNVAGGYLYEAQTRCLESRNMGAIASETSHLSFLSTRRAPITDPSELVHTAPEALTYDPATTYVAFVIGDGDNIAYLQSTRATWLRERLDACAADPASCAPLTWSISPHIARLAPDVLAWYFTTSHETGKDTFILPPSGHLYAYPTSLSPDAQDGFVEATEADARLLGTTGVVHWDWLDSWQDAQTTFLPKYAKQGGAVRGLFAVNVPYLIEPFPSWPADKFYEVLTGADGGRAVLFRQREWRGVDGTGSAQEAPFRLTPESMAAEIAGYPPGTVTWVYMTSDGGLNLQNSFLALTKLLPERVRLVSTDTAAELALAAAER